MGPRRLRRVRGFSLLEIMLSIFAIGVAIAAFVPCSIGSRKMVAHNRYTDLATSMASATLDYERSLGYLNIATGTTALPPGIVQPDLPRATGAVTVGLLDSTLQPTNVENGRKKVDVTVSWNDKHGEKGSVTVSTIIAND